MVLGFFREDTRLLAFPPLLARAFGVPGWNTRDDRLEFRAAREKGDLIRSGKSPEEAEAGAAEYLEAARAEPPGGALKENWMIFAGLALLVVLPAIGFSFFESLFWAVVATGVLSSPRMMDGLERGALNSLIIGVTAGVMGIVLARRLDARPRHQVLGHYPGLRGFSGPDAGHHGNRPSGGDLFCAPPRATSWAWG